VFVPIIFCLVKSLRVGQVSCFQHIGFNIFPPPLFTPLSLSPPFFPLTLSSITLSLLSSHSLLFLSLPSFQSLSLSLSLPLSLSLCLSPFFPLSLLSCSLLSSLSLPSPPLSFPSLLSLYPLFLLVKCLKLFLLFHRCSLY
jgi:hypothetical protein